MKIILVFLGDDLQIGIYVPTVRRIVLPLYMCSLLRLFLIWRQYASPILLCFIYQGCTIPSDKTLCGGASVWNLLHIILLEPRVFKLHLSF
jgi:hypothetical protein